MFQLVGYNFYSDGDALNATPSQVDGVNMIVLAHAIFEHFNVTKNTTLEFNTSVPQIWDYDTLLDTAFAGDVTINNLGFGLSQINAIQIKRRKKGEFDWITLDTIAINSIEDIGFVFKDYYATYGVDYEYAFVPTLGVVEGAYIINEVTSKFNGVFIADADTAFKLMFGVGYSGNARNQRIGTFEPLGRKYPVVVANGSLSYESGSVSATIMNDAFETNGTIDRTAIVKKKDELKDFLTNRKPKILKDWNGNTWLCVIVGSPSIAYTNQYGMGIPSITFDWVEVGDHDNEADLVAANLIQT